MTREELKLEIETLTEERTNCIELRSKADKRGREIEKEVKKLTMRLIDSYEVSAVAIPLLTDPEPKDIAEATTSKSRIKAR